MPLAKKEESVRERSRADSFAFDLKKSAYFFSCPPQQHEEPSFSSFSLSEPQPQDEEDEEDEEDEDGQPQLQPQPHPQPAPRLNCRTTIQTQTATIKIRITQLAVLIVLPPKTVFRF